MNNNGFKGGSCGASSRNSRAEDVDTLLSVPFCLPKKLQVTEKDGSFIALDNNSLKLMRQLERLGHCTEVEVEIVPLSKVPPNVVQEMSILEQQSNGHLEDSTEEETSRKSKVCCTRGTTQNRRVIREKPQFACSQHSHSGCPVANGNLANANETSVLKPKKESVECKTSTSTTSSTTTSFTLNGFNTYLSDQQLRAARMSNTMTVMAPCLRQPITTSTPTSDLTMRQFKWQHCCSEREQHRAGKGCQNHHHQQNFNCSESAGNGKWRQCDSSPVEDSVVSGTTNGANCCICSSTRGDREESTVQQQQRCPRASCPPTSSHHHHHNQQCLHSHDTKATRVCYCTKRAHGCVQHRSAKSNCLNNNCPQNEADGETDDDEEEEEELSSENEDEDTEEEGDEEQKGDEDPEDEDDSDEDDESNEEDEEDEEEEDAEEDEENGDCGNSFNMRVLRRPGSMSDNEDEEEEEGESEMETCLHEVELFACNVCDQTYQSARNLAKHQVHKRHFGCSICDTLFSSLQALEEHKHTLEHWSDDDDQSTVSLSLTGPSTSRHHCSASRLAGHVVQHNHPILSNHSSHGYPSDSRHLHNHGHEELKGRAGQKQQENQIQTRLSLHSTTIAGLLDSKWSLGNGKDHHGAQNNRSDLSFSQKWSLGGNRPEGEAAFRCKTVQPVISPKQSKPTILASSLSSKLMASVFNFSSSNGSILSMHSNTTSQCKTAANKETLHSHKRLSRSAEEMESLL